MYEEHFGFESLPFETVSNGSVYVDLPSHREAANTALFALASGEGFVKVVGEVGTGKTALCRMLMNELSDEDAAVYLPNPALDPDQLAIAIADELGAMPDPDSGRYAIQKRIRAASFEVARAGGRVVVFVDEAQTMPDESLEELRLLSNLESNHGRLVQVVLFGQPELDERLAGYSLRPLQQRIAFSACLEPFDAEACRSYVLRRLMQAGAHGQSVFTPAALDRIHRASGGIPRLVNVLCHKSLLAAFSAGRLEVGPRDVARALKDTEGIRRWRLHPLFRSRADAPFGERSPSSRRRWLGLGPGDGIR